MSAKYSIAVLGAVLGLSLSFTPQPSHHSDEKSFVVTFSQADARGGRRGARHAARRTTRRVARRTTRRVYRRNSVANCAYRSSYYYCGGVYYRPVVEGGTTVYVVVNP